MTLFCAFTLAALALGRVAEGSDSATVAADTQASVPDALDAYDRATAAEVVDQSDALLRGHGTLTAALSANAKRCELATDCVTMAQLKDWYKRQEENIEDNVPDHWQKFAQDTVDEAYAKNWARIRTDEVKARVPAKYQSKEEAKIAQEFRQEMARIEGRNGAKVQQPATTSGGDKATDAIQTEEQLQAWRKKQEADLKANVPGPWQKFAQATIDEEYAKISARVKAVEAAHQSHHKPPEGEQGVEDATSEKQASVLGLGGEAPQAAAKFPLLAAAGLTAAFALAAAGMLAGASWRRQSLVMLHEDFDAPFLRLEAAAWAPPLWHARTLTSAPLPLRRPGA